jgi:hypothetical protein
MRKAGLICAFALSGCASYSGIHSVHPLRPLQIATAPYQPVATTALSGSLLYDGGCLLFRGNRTGALLMPVWPAGTIFNGTAVIYHEPGRADEPVMVAEQFLMEGQPLQWSSLTAPPYLPFQDQCGAYPPFFVSHVRPAN